MIFEVTALTDRSLDRFLGLFMNGPYPTLGVEVNEVALVSTMRAAAAANPPDPAAVMKITSQYTPGNLPQDFKISKNFCTNAFYEAPSVKNKGQEIYPLFVIHHGNAFTNLLSLDPLSLGPDGVSIPPSLQHKAKKSRQKAPGVGARARTKQPNRTHSGIAVPTTEFVSH